MKLKVLLFARAREIVRQSSIEIEVKEGCTVRDLVTELVRLYPDFDVLMKNMVLSVDLEYTPVDSDLVLTARSEVSIV